LINVHETEATYPAVCRQNFLPRLRLFSQRISVLRPVTNYTDCGDGKTLCEQLAHCRNTTVEWTEAELEISPSRV